ncbi:MEGF6-like protein [Mya arenaria]|uniref:MEGF6-like protein n=1 Tax=Mya arenaria TaxID=6604 RepID=A0ABY7EZH2_MYAAR|nr:MEGF6-like protein [Mya arenaria]
MIERKMNNIAGVFASCDAYPFMGGRNAVISCIELEVIDGCATDNKTCEDVNECESGDSCCPHICHNNQGGYTCECREGFQQHVLDGCICLDVDECLANNGGCKQLCVNNEGSFSCACRPGFYLASDRNTCQEIRSAHRGRTSTRPGRGEIPYLRYDTTPIPIIPVDDYNIQLPHEQKDQKSIYECIYTCADCLHGGYCNTKRNGCLCAAGWQGLICNETCHEGTYGSNCNSICTCENGGTCDHVTGKCKCPPGVKGEKCEDGCPPGFYGDICDKPCPKVCPTGYCDRMFGFCECLPGYFGPSCNIPCPEFTFGANCNQHCDCEKDKTSKCNPKSPFFACSAPHQLVPKGGSAKIVPGSADARAVSVTQSRASAAVRPGGRGGGVNVPVSPECMAQGARRSVNVRTTPSVTIKQETVCAPRAGLAGIVIKNVRTTRSVLVVYKRVNAGTTPPVITCPVCVGANRAGEVDSAAKGRYGEKCERFCECLNGGTCDPVTGMCVCLPGWHGALCEEECEVGRYGIMCYQRCFCSGHPCNRVTGECNCTAGYMGIACEKTCPEGRYGANCAKSCACKNSDSCNKETGRCHCLPGYIGEECDEACLPGTYGDRCEQPCQCKENQPCYHVTGECACPPGYTGPACEQQCSEGTFGPDCQGSCTCNRNQNCDHVTGDCVCKPGQKGKNCQKENDQGCNDGEYGPSCERTCECEYGGLCDVMNGRCFCRHGYIACEEGFFGIDCEEECECGPKGHCDPISECPKGTHGDYCSERCDCKNEASCDHVTGSCDCKPGYTGLSCQEKCSNETYGLRCAQLCSCEEFPCHHISGECICPPGLEPPDCRKPCQAGRYGPSCQFRCDCDNGATCDHVTGACLCVYGWIGPRCEHQLMSGLTCLYCSNVIAPRLCKRVMECGADEVCEAQRSFNEFGETTYNLGCSQRSICQNVTSSNQYSPCRKCCDTDICNHVACGEQGNIATTATMTCHVNNEPSIIGKRDPARSSEVNRHCRVCCSSDLCNNGCISDDCSDLRRGNSYDWPSGVYHVFPNNSESEVAVLCDMKTDGGGWTIFQHRFDGSIAFNRSYDDYVDGFGSFAGEYWMGLNLLYNMASAYQNYTLRVDLSLSDGSSGYDVYSGFWIRSPAYKLNCHVLTVTDKYLLSDTRDFRSMNGCNFSTYDQDNDNSDRDSINNCAELFGGGWWYNDCMFADLNGPYDTYYFYYSSFQDGSSYKLETSKMMFRPT